MVDKRPMTIDLFAEELSSGRFSKMTGNEILGAIWC